MSHCCLIDQVHGLCLVVFFFFCFPTLHDDLANNNSFQYIIIFVMVTLLIRGEQLDIKAKWRSYRNIEEYIGEGEQQDHAKGFGLSYYIGFPAHHQARPCSIVKW
jgi:hypothetical protein